MTEPFARPTAGRGASDGATARAPQAFRAQRRSRSSSPSRISTPSRSDAIEPAPLPRGMGWLGRLAWSAGGLLRVAWRSACWPTG